MDRAGSALFRARALDESFAAAVERSLREFFVRTWYWRRAPCRYLANARPPAFFHVTRPAGPRAHFHLLPLDGPLAPNRARKVVVYVLPSRPRALRSRFLRCKGVQKRRCTRPSRLGGRAGPILITRPSRPSHAPWGSRNASSMKRSAPHGFVGAPRRPEGRHPGCDEVAMTSAREVSC